VKAKFGKKVCDLPQPIEQFLKLRISLVVREKASVKRDQAQAKTFRQRGALLQIVPILFPGLIGSDSASALNRFHGGIILAYGGDHSGNQFNAVQGAERPD